ncbi:gamma-tubulin complex component 6 [Nymphalis io]|uniref:gamma-tubulin complex component 6 n=1 Tax=Inachis io TaxID=171585 RepID=UPI0021671749|nr:gamma-tubulin complex component 6 [Nymphalis io]XP_050343977.1 gamma-tubulin complex component 6 [Nymphalis io]
MSYSSSNTENAGVYELITKLCEKMAEKYCDNSRLSVKLLTSKLRAQSYEVILKRSSTKASTPKSDPIKDLLSHQFVSQLTVKNVAEYKRSIALKKIIINIRKQDFGEKKDQVNNVLRLLIGLQNSINEDLSSEMFQNPFSFGLFDEMLPKPKREIFGSPQPYAYFPKHVFELPYSLKHQENIMDKKKCYTEYTVESFDSRSFIPDIQSQKGIDDMKSFQSPMSIASMTSTALSSYTESTIINCPRLTAPRDLHIPKSEYTDVKVSLVSTSVKSEVPDVFQVKRDDSMDIWEIVTQIDKDIPEDIWEVVSKMPLVKERQLIASSSREMCLWRSIYGSELSDLNIISERQFIRHIMYLIIGVETNSFPFSEASNCFYIKDNLVLEAISKEHLRGYIAPLLLVGTYYRRLYNFAFNLTAEDHFHTKGLVFEAAREVIRRYLLEFRLTATEIYEEYCKNNAEELNCMPTLLQILHHMEPLNYEIETIASIYKMVDADSTSIPYGAELMSYLFNEISLVTHRKTALTLFNSLFSICRVYFKFIERFIFEGELDDIFNEFFIRKDNQYVNSRSKRYWDKGFHIMLSVAVPDFLRPLATFILLCGKSLRLLKLCNPSDPLVLLISSDHPSVRCCASFEQLERQQEILDVYRTRCLFVSGETVTFEQILLKREAERKAFTEMASLKQAETMEKIVAERKRLAQLIIAEKQHSLRILEAAMAEAKASKTKGKKRQGKLCKLEEAAEKATEEVDSKLRDDEKSKIMEYYSKLNMEVEKSKIHTEWKIKRLQLDQSRMQLLSTEERNLKREKLELEHQRNEIMAMSIQSDFKSDDDLDTVDNNNGDMENNSTAGSTPSADIIEEPESSAVSEFNRNREKTQNSSDVFNAICNVAKSIFGVSKSKASSPCDNEVEVDIQGNVVNAVTEIHHKTKADQTSNDVIGANLDNAIDNLRFLESKQEALKNKQKVMAHEFGQIDNENNQKDISPTINYPSLDEENNEKFLTPNAEAKRNKQKVLGAEFGMVKQEVKEIVTEPRNEAQKEALINKQKVLGVEYNLPFENIPKKEPANVAQEEAIRNKNRNLGSNYERTMKIVAKFDAAKKSALRLNLKPYSDTIVTKTSSVTPNTGAITPGELFPGLDLETPTTAEMPLDGAMTSEIFTPRSEGNKDPDSAKVKPDKEFLTSQGFNFSLIVEDDTVVSEDISDAQTEVSPENSPLKSVDFCNPISSKRSLFNIIDGSYSLESFDPFGVKQLQNYSKDYFNNKINEDSNSIYTHPAVLMEEVKKRPYNNIFMSHCDHEEEDQKISCDNIATLTACLQRSVMLPLTYQLEVVNNSILTHFLVNLDMYEHLRSLKDYFFLMDGEFSRSICHNLFAKLTKTLNPQELLNFATLHNILDKALGSSISHVHKFSENLSFTITESPLSFQHSSPDVLQCLSLTYSVSWPLNIILSQEALQRYAKVFQFLIKMRRIFWVLSEDFVALKLTAKLSREHSRKLLKSSQYISVQIYRHNMASLIRALDNYIVTTCILTSWTEFEKDLKKAKTLDDLYECHVVYIKKVLFRCLLNNRSTPVMKLLNDIFTVILKFNRVLKAGEWRQNAPNSCFTHTSYVQLEELFHLFEKLAKYLHKVITKLMECGYQRHLVELLTMVNLNGYYDPDRSKEDTNISLQST